MKKFLSMLVAVAIALSIPATLTPVFAQEGENNFTLPDAGLSVPIEQVGADVQAIAALVPTVAQSGEFLKPLVGSPSGTALSSAADFEKFRPTYTPAEDRLDPAGNYYLTGNIVFSDEWAPINATFSGTLDGRGNTIIWNNIDGNAALFNTANDATVRNLRINYVAVSSQGLFATVNEFGVSFENCFADGTISTSERFSGAFVGTAPVNTNTNETNILTFKDCYSSVNMNVTVLVNGPYIGGFVGSGRVDITDSYYNGNMVITYDDSRSPSINVGGFVGGQSWATYGGGGSKIERSFATGALSVNLIQPNSATTSVGGFAGTGVSYIKDSYSAVNVHVNTAGGNLGNSQVIAGGMVGGIDGSGILDSEPYVKVENAYVTGDIKIINKGTAAGPVGGIMAQARSLGARPIDFINVHYSGDTIESWLEDTPRGFVGGLIGTVQLSDGTIKFNKCYSNATNIFGGQTGGLAGALRINAEYENCYNKSNITANANGGGLSGGFSATTIKNSFNEGNISTDIAGGFLGQNENSRADVTIQNSYSECDITASRAAGQFIGYLSESSVTTSLTQVNDSYAKGEITAEFEGIAREGATQGGIPISIGGLIGRGCNLSTDNVYSDVKITANLARPDFSATNQAYVGGIIGYGWNVNEMKDTRADGDITVAADFTTTHAGGLVGGTDRGNADNESLIMQNVNYNGNLNIVATDGSAVSVGGLYGLRSGAISTLCDIQPIIKNAHVNGDIFVQGSGRYNDVGGLFGRFSTGARFVVFFEDCSFTGKFESKTNITTSVGTNPSDSIGGILGYSSDTSVSFDNVRVNIVDGMKIESNIIVYAGGIIGNNSFTSNSPPDNEGIEIINSVFNGEIIANVLSSGPTTAQSIRIGGLAGDLVGNLTLKSNQFLGGISVTTDISFTGASRGDCAVGGLIGRASLQRASGYGGSFNYILTIEECSYIGDISVIDTAHNVEEPFPLYTGGLVGRANSSTALQTFITDSYSKGDINVNTHKGVAYTGGIIGVSPRASFNNVNYEGNLTTTTSSGRNTDDITHYTGGLIGELYISAFADDTVQAVINSSGAKGNITARTNGLQNTRTGQTALHNGTRVGGLIGEFAGGNATTQRRASLSVQGSDYKGDISAVNTGFGSGRRNPIYVGGLIGNSDFPISGIIDSRADGDIYALTEQGQIYAGGIVGNSSRRTSLDNVYYAGDITAILQETKMSDSVGTGTLLSSPTPNGYAGGLFGFYYLATAGDEESINSSGFNGNISLINKNHMYTNSNDNANSFAGGLIGLYQTVNVTTTVIPPILNINNSYWFGDKDMQRGTLTVSNPNATDEFTGSTQAQSAYAGGLVGNSEGTTSRGGVLNINSSGAFADVFAYSKGGNVFTGGFVGSTAGVINIFDSNQRGEIEGKAGDTRIAANAQAGGLIGSIGTNATGGTIINSTADGSVKGQNNTGGLIGQGRGIWIENSRNVNSSGSIIGNNRVGGVVGHIVGGTNDADASTIIKSGYSGNVSGIDYVGGIIGAAGQPGNNGQHNNSGNVKGYTQIKDSYSEGDINGAGNYVGGIAGYLSGTATNSSGISGGYSAGKISGETYVGGVVGSAYGTPIERFLVLNAVNGNSYIGGVAGSFVGGESSVVAAANIEDSFSHGDVSGEGDYVGGIAGQINFSTMIIDTGSWGNVSGADYVGGVVGYLQTGSDSRHSSSGVINNYANGDISGKEYVGGIVGNAQGRAVERRALITNNHSTGKINGANYVGGILGLAQTNVVVDENYSLSDITAQTHVGGIVGNTIGGSTANRNSVTNCYSMGNVSGVDYIGGVIGSTGTSPTNGNGNTNISNNYATGRVEGQNYVGGIFGFIRPITTGENNIALNFTVRATGENVGRIAGFRQNTNTAILNDNFAFSGILTGGGTAFSGNIMLDGESKTAAQLEYLSGFPVGFNLEPWVYEQGMLPGLGAAVEMPEHLEPGFVAEVAFNFSVNGGNGGLKVTVNGREINSSDLVERGSTVIVTAEPTQGYRVKQWAVNDTPQNGNSMRIFVTNIRTPHTATVEFEQLGSDQFIRGDCNGDGLINATDLSTLKAVLTGQTPKSSLTAGKLAAMDINKDEKLNIADMTYLKYYLVMAVGFVS
ncbi:MAG: dockerin type I repeat-containing protein [Oscillospiraceae bacterium]|nr:dockerin type I repeat-containing protein [Oscillospiraceae bacterium]